MTVDLSMIPDVALRREAAKLWQNYKEAERAFEESDQQMHPDTQAKLYALEREYYENRNAILRTALESDLACALNDAKAMQEAHDAPSLLVNHDDEVVYCSLSGLPIFYDDEYLQDPETDEYVLRCFAGLPQRVIEREEAA